MSEYQLTLEDDDSWSLTLSDQGVSIPTAHAASHTAAGSDPLTLASTQITGLGTMSTQAASAVNITGGAISGITDLAVADGGTGASTAAAARTNLGLGSIATQGAGAVAITGGTIANATVNDATINRGTIADMSSIGVEDITATGALQFDTLTGVLIGNAAAAVTASTASTVGAVLRCTGTNTYAFGAVNMADTDAVTGALPIANGGTGATSAATARTALGIVSGTGTLNGTSGVVITIAGVTTGSKFVATMRDAAVGTQGLLRVDHGAGEITVFSTEASDTSAFTYFGIL